MQRQSYLGGILVGLLRYLAIAVKNALRLQILMPHELSRYWRCHETGREEVMGDLVNAFLQHVFRPTTTLH